MDRRLFLSLSAGLFSLPLRARAVPAPPVPLRRLRLRNAHTGETFEGSYRDDRGPIPRVMDELSVFLRDHHSGEKIAIDVAVLDFLAGVIDSVGQTRATVLSAYRTHETNEMLARTTFGVAENSQHIYGRALDVCVDSRLQDAMNSARTMRRGGVGWYPHSGFIHIDSGPVRNWTLDEAGLGRLLFDGRNINLHEPLTVAATGEVQVGRGRRPMNVSERLSLHRLLAKAEMLANRP